MSSQGGNQGQILDVMLQIQVETLEAEVDRERELHRKASQRASKSEQRNKVLRENVERLQNELYMLEQCWNCDKLGDHKTCQKCGNSAIFVWESGRYTWRGTLTKGEQNGN